MTALLTALQNLSAKENRPYSAAELETEYKAITGENISPVSIGMAASWGFTSWSQQDVVLKDKVNSKMAYRLKQVEVLTPDAENAIAQTTETLPDTETDEQTEPSLVDWAALNLPHNDLQVIESAIANLTASPNTPPIQNAFTTVNPAAMGIEVDSTQAPLFFGDDDIPDEPGSSSMSTESKGDDRPNWRRLFGLLDEDNPIAARVAALMACWYHPSFDESEQKWLCSLVKKGMELLRNGGSESDVMDVAINIRQFNFQPSKHGWIVAALIQAVAPKPLLKNPLIKFDSTQGTYAFTNGQRNPKIGLITMVGQSGAGKSEFEKWLGSLCDVKHHLGSKPMAASSTIARIKDNRLGKEAYTLGWKGQPVENWDKDKNEFFHPLFCFSDLSRGGEDQKDLVSTFKSICEPETPITRQTSSLDSDNKSWLLYGANVCFSTVKAVSSDPEDLLAEITRRSVVIFCKKIESDPKGLRIKPLLTRFESIDWSDFSLSCVWKTQFFKQNASNSPNRFVATKDSVNGDVENGYLVFHIQRELARLLGWQETYKFPSDRWDFMAANAAYAMVAFVINKGWLSEDELVACYQNYFSLLEAGISKSSTTTSELKRQFKVYVKSLLLQAKKRLGNEFNEKTYPLKAREIEHGYNAIVKLLKPKGNDRIPLIELMAEMGYAAHTEETDNDNDMVCVFLPIPEESEEETTNP